MDGSLDLIYGPEPRPIHARPLIIDSVCRRVARALVRENCSHLMEREAA